MERKLKKSRRQAEKSVKRAKAELADFEYEVTVNGRKFQFQTDLFDLEVHNIGILNEQITAIPASLAYVSQALAEAETVSKRANLDLEIFMAEKMSTYNDEKTESAKKTRVQHNYSTEYSAKVDAIREADYMVRVIRGYREGIEAKYQLAQTLSANLRTERESFQRMG